MEGAHKRLFLEPGMEQVLVLTPAALGSLQSHVHLPPHRGLPVTLGLMSLPVLSGRNLKVLSF